MKPVFANPLRKRSKGSEFYPYYAGFSDAFVEDAIRWLDLKNGTVLDPWLGAGTTTHIAKKLHINSKGFDLNPVMVIIAKAGLIDRIDVPVLEPLAKKIISFSENISPPDTQITLETFFDNQVAHKIQALALAIWQHLVNSEDPDNNTHLDCVSPIPAIFFVGLFNIVRSLLKPLFTSNPTWIKIPSCSTGRIFVTNNIIQEMYLNEINRLAHLVLHQTFDYTKINATVSLADSRNLPLQDNSINGIVTSPPYCTRLDYGRTTMPELQILESIGLAKYEESRLKLIGTSITAHRQITKPPSHTWGKTCGELLEQIFNHSSKASKTYYYRSHYAYFEDLACSISECARVMSTNSKACIVVQDSFYKDLHNDLPKIFSEMAAHVGLTKIDEFVYQKKQSFCRINPAISAYRSKRNPLEAVLLFKKG